MANTNRNRSWGSSHPWEQNRDRRVSRQNDNTQNYESYGSEHLDYEQGDENRYLNTSGYGGNYTNRNTGGMYGGSRGRLDSDNEGYGYQTNAGQYGYGGNTYGSGFQNQPEWQRNRNVGNSYQGEQDDWNRNRNSNYGGYGGYYGASYGDRSRGDYQRSMYGGDTRNFGNANQGGIDRGNSDRDWWDRTKDEVSSWFGDDDARRRRDFDKQYAHRGKGPKGYRRSEDRIREDVNDRLTDDPFIDASDIDVKVEDCVVILTGTVDSREDKRRAEDVVERISGVKDVENRLRVKTDKNDKTDRGGSDMSRGDREVEIYK